jgi:protein-tyrosine phosphatase
MHTRQLKFEGCYNLRDIGGYPTLDGRQTRWHTIFRSDSLHRLALEGRQALLSLGLRTVIDLRWPDEVLFEPNVLSREPSVRYVPLSFYGSRGLATLDFPKHMGAIYRLDLERQRQQIRTVLERLLLPETLPALIHCAVGKDRTGLIIALLLGIAGVRPEEIVADYALSADCLAPYFDELRQVVTPEALADYGFSLECRPEFMADTLAYLDERYGGPAGYARDLGLSNQQIARLRALLVE